MSDLLRIPTICQQLGVSRWTWRKWVKTGVAPSPVDHLPGHPRWQRADVDRFAAGLFRAPGRRAYFGAARQLRSEQVVARRVSHGHSVASACAIENAPSCASTKGEQSC